MTNTVALVTGVTGFLGRHLVEAILEHGGFDLIGFHRPNADTSYLQSHGIRLVAGDITSYADVRRAITRRVDVVFHLAADTSLWARTRRRQEDVNVRGTENVVQACLEVGTKKLVHTSSIASFGLQTEQVIDETSPSTASSSPVSYVRTKWQAERLVLAATERGLNATILNPCNIMGRYDRHNWARLMQYLLTSPLALLPPGRGSFCDAREVARAHIAAYERGGVGERYILGGEDASYKDFATTLSEVTGVSIRALQVHPLPLALLGRVSDALSYVTRREAFVTADSAALVSTTMTGRSTKAERELSYRTRPLAAMIRDSYEWLSEHAPYLIARTRPPYDKDPPCRSFLGAGDPGCAYRKPERRP